MQAVPGGIGGIAAAGKPEESRTHGEQTRNEQRVALLWREGKHLAKIAVPQLDAAIVAIAHVGDASAVASDFRQRAKHRG